MNEFSVADLKENTYFSAEAMLDKTFLLLNNSLPITQQLIKALTDWGFKQIYSEGTISKEKTDTDLPDIGEPKSAAPVEDMSTRIRKALEKQNAAAHELKNTETDRFNSAQSTYNEYQDYIASVYAQAAAQKALNLEQLSEKVKNLCVFVKNNQRYVLRIQPEQGSSNKNFLIGHSMRTAVLAIAIGLQLRLPLPKLIELGVACILHEIGMLRLPPQLYLTNKPLSPAEKKAIATHPVIAYNILKGYNFPLPICLAVLEHHEKENGAGYPRRLAGTQISVYAKIIAVACSYDAITSPRQYKEAQNLHAAMVEILKNTGKQYNENVIKALLLCLSLYPIGAYVYLANGKAAQVIEVNPESPKNPVVQIFNEKNSLGEPITVQTDDKINKIIRALDKKETEDLLKTVR
ncbi:MAG: HD-GYP domain-containing protein [Bacteroides sp.]|nr:HD-GYP domain-containing protein [Prevotella sp.]MCM1408752.1 HD-GYP domain-containing protein [Treponema brennaborense]MCM1470667.1 HD-GYP domain-containing protein [Bacteroides sp.]